MKRETNPLRAKMKHLKINGVPVLVASAKERADAHNVARDLGMTIKTEKRVVVNGFEIHRVK
jgi:hydroxymethylpyrimidine pyrophosphatase-like HAD family hydrolase